MIKLEKIEEPDILAQNAAQWTEVVVTKIDNGEEPTRTERSRYNHREIKEALLQETNSKCAYCESKFRHVTYGDVEHVVPKSNVPAKWFDWQNLTVACDVCNTNKSDAPVDGESFIDPYDVDPEQHFWHIGSTVWAKPGCDAAALTERLLDLNRVDLVERRAERLRNLMRMLEVVERCQKEELKKALWEEFVAEAGSQREYAALARSLMQVARQKLNRE